MKLLILGGTRFLGRHLVDIALTRGHEITLFNRGKSNPGLFPETENLIGDRDGGLDVLKGRTWDAVIDTCGYFPRIVGDSAKFLSSTVGHYTFISSISVYADTDEKLDENAPVGTIEDETVEEITGETYGPLKAFCEQIVQSVYPDGALIIRPGLIVGPHDPSDRFTYWPVRLARGGDVLAPGDPKMPVQIIDVRDLSGWILNLVEKQVTGVFNATGPAELHTMEDVLIACQTVCDTPSSLIWVGEDFLLEQQVAPFTELPLWLPKPAWGTSEAVISRAIAAGLEFRPLSETIADTLAWDRARPADREWVNGLSPTRETELLTAWKSRQ